MFCQIDVIFSDSRWKKIPKLKSRLAAAVVATQTLLPKKLVLLSSVTLVLTNDRAVCKLNRDFRGIDKPTNVLSFPQFEPRHIGKFRKAKEPVHIGDIILAYQYVVAESKKDHKILINHVTHLFIHGFLHLLGYDHVTEAEAGRMERLEQKIMDRLKLPDPYAAAKVAARKTKTKKK